MGNDARAGNVYAERLIVSCSQGNTLAVLPAPDNTTRRNCLVGPRRSSSGYRPVDSYTRTATSSGNPVALTFVWCLTKPSCGHAVLWLPVASFSAARVPATRFSMEYAWICLYAWTPMWRRATGSAASCAMALARA